MRRKARRAPPQSVRRGWLMYARLRSAQVSEGCACRGRRRSSRAKLALVRARSSLRPSSPAADAAAAPIATEGGCRSPPHPPSRSPAPSAAATGTAARLALTARSRAGRPDESQTIDAPNGTFSALSAGGTHACAIRTSGVLACWGDGSVRATDQHSDRDVHSGERRRQSQLRDAQRRNARLLGGQRPRPAQQHPDRDVLSGRASAIYHSCAIRSAGTLICWGDNGLGQLNNVPTGTFSAVTSAVFTRARSVPPERSSAGEATATASSTTSRPERSRR